MTNVGWIKASAKCPKSKCKWNNSNIIIFVLLFRYLGKTQPLCVLQKRFIRLIHHLTFPDQSSTDLVEFKTAPTNFKAKNNVTKKLTGNDF